MGEMADQIIEDGMNTPCVGCGALWPEECDKDCELANPPKPPKKRKKVRHDR